jgi:dihydrofolate reductase
MPKPIRIIAACARNRVIGRGGKLPWEIPEDRAYLETQTRGHTVILGRWSYVRWPEVTRSRDVVVITSDHTLAPPGVGTATCLNEAIALAQGGTGDIFICGGAGIYTEALPLAELLFLTIVDADVAGDTYFPDWTPYFTREIAGRDSRNDHWRYSFRVLAR